MLKWLSGKFELSRGGNASNLRPMEGLRGLAALLVFLAHFVTLMEPWIVRDVAFFKFATALHTIGHTGVDLFFVLSGFLIYGSLISKHSDFRVFITRRVARIYPAFTVVFVVYVVLSFVYPAENKIPRDNSEALIYLGQNFLLLPGLFPIRPMISVAWSLSYEMFFYLAIPLVVAIFKMRERAVLFRMCFFISVAILFVYYCSTSGAYQGGHIRLTLFISGILLYEVMKNSNHIVPSSLFAFSIFIAGILLSTLVPVGAADGHVLKACVLCITYFVVLLSCFRNPTGWFSRCFAWTPLRWLGNMSYSYYLIHGLTLKGLFLFLPKLLPPNYGHGFWIFWMLLPLFFIISLLPATALFVLIERPFSLNVAGRQSNRRDARNHIDA